MPRIRKKTSKRVTLHRRERIKHKVKESRKKKGKAARKAPEQWKSKHPKDLGIPNAFPYKDQILAEVAEQRRAAAEAKQRRKDEKSGIKATKPQDEDEDEDVDVLAVEEAGTGAGDASDAFDGVRALAGRAQLKRQNGAAGIATHAKEGGGEQVEEGAEEEEGVPMLVNPDLPNLRAVLDAADVLVQLLDARDPLTARCVHLEEVAVGLGKRVLLVLNKVDACPREAVEAWAAVLRRQHPTVLFRSATACLPVSSADASTGKGKGKARADDAWGLESVMSVLQQWTDEQAGDKSLTIAVAGVTNVGKSSFVNSLLRKAALETYKLTSTMSDAPTTTTYPQEVVLELSEGKQLRLIDTPGVLWHPAEDASPEESARLRARDILLRNRGHIERLKDPSLVMSELVSRVTREDLMLLYNLPIFTDGDANAFLMSVARANGFVKKKGQLDLAGAARMVLRDWRSGKLARFTLPADAPSSPPADAPVANSALTRLYAKDAAILSRLSTRKQLRKAGGLVKLRTGAADARKVMLDASYSVSSSDEEGNEGDEEDAGTVDDADEVGMLDEESEGDYVSGEEGEDSEEDEDEDVGEVDDDAEEDADEEAELASPRPLSGKRKRAVAKAPVRPAKRVAFAPEPKGTKQARSAAGAKGKTKARAQRSNDKPEPSPKPTKKQNPRKAPAQKTAPKPTSAKKAANASSSKKSGAASASQDGELAYDFKQFF